MEEGRVHHLPIVDEGHLVGMWVATDAGPVVMLAPERLGEVSPEAAIDVVARMMGDESVVAISEGRPVGILTRTYALDLVRGGLATTHSASIPSPWSSGSSGPPRAARRRFCFGRSPAFPSERRAAQAPEEATAERGDEREAVGRRRDALPHRADGLIEARGCHVTPSQSAGCRPLCRRALDGQAMGQPVDLASDVVIDLGEPMLSSRHAARGLMSQSESQQ